MAYFSQSGKIPWDSDCWKIYVKDLLICLVHKFIIWFDKPPYPKEFLEFNEVIVFILSLWWVLLTLLENLREKNSLNIT